MQYINPIVRGMYPDPSVCRANGKYYMVCSTMMWFPGIPLFESVDMVNWTQIGHCLTRKSQAELENTEICSGIFAPTIRYNNGRFYVVTTESMTNKNFYVYTDDIYGEWSEPVYVDRDGIDPTLYFEDGKCYFMSNGSDNGKGCIHMCEIDVQTGEIISPVEVLWHGAGGRFMEAPHLYHIGEYYYVLDAEGGTEYGHMVCYGRSKNMMGPFEEYPNNPVLTNRNLGGFQIQGAGHGDLIEDNNGKWWFVHLAFRQAGVWQPYHHLGREVCLVPVEWTDDGWFTIGNGTCEISYDLPDRMDASPQQFVFSKTLADLSLKREYTFIREYDENKYKITDNSIKMIASESPFKKGTLPTFIGIRQSAFNTVVTCDIEGDADEAGVSVYMDDMHHYDIYKNSDNKVYVRRHIGDVEQISGGIAVNGKARVKIDSNAYTYTFSIVDDSDNYVLVETATTKYVSTEVTSGFTGVVIGMYADGEAGKTATFTNFVISNLGDCD